MNLFDFRSVCFQRDQLDVLKHMTFTISRNRKTAIVGPNGAGKSTINFHLNGLFTPKEGEIYFQGELIDKKLRQALTSKVGIVFQDPDDQIISLTVRDDVAFGPLQFGVSKEEAMQRVDHYLQLLDITHLADRNPSELSYGQKKYVTIAGILAIETDTIVFDEPMAFLDPAGKERMVRIMNELHDAGKTIIVTTHDMHFVTEWADEVIVIHEGQCLGKFTSRELFANKNILEKARLNLPPVVELLEKVWQEHWGQMPLTIAEAESWLRTQIKK